MSPQDRAKAAHAMAEASAHPRDKAAWKAAARLWERVGGPGEPLSLEPVTRELAELRRDVARATGPLQPPRPPKAPSPRAASVRDLGDPAFTLPPRQREVIEF